jgi:pimeloyl-ACP methyl ester carboxylesterase
MIARTTTEVLDIAYEDDGDPQGWPVLLSHGFPYDVRAFDDVVRTLTARGARVLRPYLRGYGATQFRSQSLMRSGQQGALASDLIGLMDAVKIDSAILGGYDWGGRASCIVAALWPERVRGLVTVNGYNILNISEYQNPISPENEHRFWYQYYFHGERGRRGLFENRKALCRLLWKQWSPNWAFDERVFHSTAVSFENPDFVDVVIHSYQHRFGLVAGDSRYAWIEGQLARNPSISVPVVSLEGTDDGVMELGGTAGHSRYFSNFYEYRLISGAGHNLPQEHPDAFANAVLTIHARPGRRSR